eukprot:5338803-Alexandrium_andersonii.AAC.1
MTTTLAATAAEVPRRPCPALGSGSATCVARASTASGPGPRASAPGSTSGSRSTWAVPTPWASPLARGPPGPV